MIRGDSKDYELLEKWTKGFDCMGHKTCESSNKLLMEHYG